MVLRWNSHLIVHLINSGPNHFSVKKTKITEINEYINIKPCIIDHGFLGFEHDTFALTP